MYRRTGRARLLLLAFLALALVVITLDFRQGPEGAVERAKDISTAVVAPIQRGLSTVARPVADFFTSLGELSRLRQQNRELEDRLEAAAPDLTRAEAIEEENRFLRGILELQKSWATMDTVTAAVIASDPGNYEWTVVIDKGASDGVRADMAVVNPDGLVGKIIDTGGTYSVVRLIIDPQAAARARVEPSGHLGTITGNGSDESLSLRFVDTRLRVNSGNDVFTSGYDGGIFPAGIPIGEVQTASGESGASEQEIGVDPWVDFRSLDFVEILLESGPLLEDDPPQNRDRGGRG